MSKHEFKQNIAVVIGINNYQNGIPALETAKQDAEAIADILQQNYHYEIKSIIDHQATKQQLEQLLNICLPKRIKTPSSRLIFYFAGHGIALNGNEGPQGYLIPQDAALGAVSTYVPMQRVEAALSALPCRHCFVILDCCFAGAFRWSSTRDIGVIPEVIYKERYDRFIQDPAWQVITSTGYNQTALDNLDLKDDRGIARNQTNQTKHSPFATALMEALQGNADIYPPAKNGKLAGDGIITATELYLYLRDSVEIPTDAIKQRQTPQIWSLKKHDKGEFIFLVPRHPLNLPSAPSLDNLEENNPYRGLKSYEKKHSHLFFGRTPLIEQLYDFISHPQRPLTVVLGASGSGKSSLVKAGLMAYLDLLSQWKTLTPIRPGESPLNRLNTLIKELDNDSNTLHQAIATWGKNHPNQKLLLVIDQLEELITLSGDETEKEQFLQVLADLVTLYDNQLKIIVTLRSDFESQFSNTQLKDHWQSARFIVPAMTRNDLGEVIEEPASAKVVYFQSLEDKGYLVDRLIDEVADMPGALPLLSFALSELYLKLASRYLEGEKTGDTVDRVITWQDYGELGGVIKSLTRRADEEYNALVKEDAAYQKTIRHVMLRMVAIGGELARRRVYHKELVYPEPEYGRVKAFIKRFDGVRLLISDQDERGEYVEPAHDALVTGWEKLLSWKTEEEETLILQRRLTPAAMEWDQVKDNYHRELLDKANPILDGLDRVLFPVENLLVKLIKLPANLRQKLRRSQHQPEKLREKPEQFLWNSNPYLDVLDQEIHGENNWLNATEREFIQVSILQKRRNVSWRWRIAIAVMLGLSGLTIVALIQQRSAELNLANSLAGNSLSLFAEGKELDAFIEGIRAGKILQQYKAKDPKVLGALITNIYEASESNRLQGHDSQIYSLDISQDGKTLVSGSRDKTLRIWNLETGEMIRTFKGHNAHVWSVRMNKKDKILVSGSLDKTIKVWNLETGQLIRTLSEHDHSVDSVDISPDGQTLVSGSDDRTIKVWNLETGQLIRTLSRHDSSVDSVDISPDGQTLAASRYKNTITLWNLKTGGEILNLKGHQRSITSVKFSQDGQILVSGSGDKTIKVWNLQTGETIRTLTGHNDWVKTIDLSPNGKILVSGSSDGIIKVWNLQTGREVRTLTGHDASVMSLRVNPDGKTFVSASYDQTIKVWNLSTGKDVRTLTGHISDVNTLKTHPDGQTLVSGSSDRTIKVWNFHTGELIRTLSKQDSHVWNLTVGSDGQTLVSSSGSRGQGTIKVWNFHTGELIRTLSKDEFFVNSLSVSQDSRILVSGSSDGTIKVWNLQTEDLIHSFPAHNSSVIRTHISPDGKQLVSASSNDIIKVWNLQTGELIHTLSGHDQRIYSLRFHPKGQILLSGSGDNTIKLWNLKTGELIRTLTGHNSWVHSISVRPDGDILASSSKDGTIKLWNLETGQLISTLTGSHTIPGNNPSILSIDFSPDGQKLVSGGDDETITVWNFQLEWLMERSCNWVGNYLEHNPIVTNNQHKSLCRW